MSLFGKKPEPPPRRPAIWERAPKAPGPPPGPSRREQRQLEERAIAERVSRARREAQVKAELRRLEERVAELERERRFRG
jgi:hypothetical protein